MSKKKSKTYNVNNNTKKDKNIMKLNVREIQLNLPGLNRNDGIVKTGTGKWQDKKKKHINKLHKKQMSDYSKNNSDFFLHFFIFILD